MRSLLVPRCAALFLAVLPAAAQTGPIEVNVTAYGATPLTTDGTDEHGSNTIFIRADRCHPGLIDLNLKTYQCRNRLTRGRSRSAEFQPALAVDRTRVEAPRHVGPISVG